ncbi:MAG TPA: amidohydrolase family protein [Steroidobacteraceae bacterium]
MQRFDAGLALASGLVFAFFGAPTMAEAAAQSAAPADLVLEGGKIYTVDAARPIAEAVAIRARRVVFVGSSREVKRWIGPSTHVEELGGRMLLPGLVDSHIHPLDIVDLDVCDLKSEARTLAELSAFVAGCVTRYAVPPGGKLVVQLWNYADGNQPDAQHPTLRAALDAASTTVRIELLGNDGHHGAYNSAALAQAKNAKGQVVGLSKATLAGEFAKYRPLVGVDELAEPNGAVNEDARYLVDPDILLFSDLEAVSKVAERIPQRLNSVGITAVLDAMVPPEGLRVYDRLAAKGQLTVRARLAQFYDPSRTLTPDGTPDYDAMVAAAKKVREKYAHHPLIRADFVKLFADGVLEGNPFAVPPTLPAAASLEPFLQPIFAVDGAGHATVTGYVDTGSELCAGVRAYPESYAAAADIKSFIQTHGYHPQQCAISSGNLQHPREVILEYVRRMHLAGFNLHIHAISDRSVRTALDAIEAARAADGNSATRDGLAHVQLAAPEDVARIGRDHLYVAFTYAWMATNQDYDLTVIPFFERVHGNSYQQLHQPDSYYERNVYPVRAVQAAGGILTAGSDAPVDTRDPRPFVNMAVALTRSVGGQPPLNPEQRIPASEVIEAYTLNGARMLGIEKDAGSIAVGKSADFVLIDRDLLSLAESGHPESIADTRVLATWFRGSKVYAAPPAH